jgi:putative membrane protein
MRVRVLFRYVRLKMAVKTEKVTIGEYGLNVLRGIVIGVANIIPGVSGGTMALVLGIFERLIKAIKTISINTFLSFFKIFTFKKKNWNEFIKELKKIDFIFLVQIGIGVAIAIVSLASVMTYLLEKQHDPTYGFFFGLILASVLVPFKLIKKRTVSRFLMMVLAIAVVVGFSSLMSGEKLIEKAKEKQAMHIQKGNNSVELYKPDINPARLAFIFFAGMVAISAMILPGVSGSFLLLLLGLYFDILQAIIHMQFLILGVFALGCLIGMIYFTRLLDVLLKKWHDLTMSFLLGLVLGSLWPIWPFKTTTIVGDETIYLSNILPASINGNVIAAIITVIIGILIVAAFLVLEKHLQKTADNKK